MTHEPSQVIDEPLLNKLWRDGDYAGCIDHLEPWIRTASKCYWVPQQQNLPEDSAQLARLRLWEMFHSHLYDYRDSIWPLCHRIVKYACWRRDSKIDYHTCSLDAPLREDFDGGSTMAARIPDPQDLSQPEYRKDLIDILSRSLSLELTRHERQMALKLIGAVKGGLTMGEAVALSGKRLNRYYMSLFVKIRAANSITPKNDELADAEVYEILRRHFMLGQHLIGLGIRFGRHEIYIHQLVQGIKYPHVHRQFWLDHPIDPRTHKFNPRGKRLKVTHEEALYILGSDTPRKALALEFGVSRGTIDNILRGVDHKEAWCEFHGLEYIPKPFKPYNRVIKRVKLNKGVGKGRWTKLTDKQVIEILDLVDEGKLLKTEIARIYNTWPQTIYNILGGKTKVRVVEAYRASKEQSEIQI